MTLDRSCPGGSTSRRPLLDAPRSAGWRRPVLAGGLLFLAGACSPGVDQLSKTDNLVVVDASRLPPASPVAAPVAVNTLVVENMSSVSSEPEPGTMPLPKYVPGPPLSPKLQQAEDEIKRVTLQSDPKR